METLQGSAQLPMQFNSTLRQDHSNVFALLLSRGRVTGEDIVNVRFGWQGDLGGDLAESFIEGTLVVPFADLSRSRFFPPLSLVALSQTFGVDLQLPV